jgi:hypothetical protein
MNVRMISITGLLTLLVLTLAACGETVTPAPAAASTKQGLLIQERRRLLDRA